MSSHMYHGTGSRDLATTRLSHFLADSVLASELARKPEVRERTIKYKHLPAFDAYNYQVLPTVPPTVDLSQDTVGNPGRPYSKTPYSKTPYSKTPYSKTHRMARLDAIEKRVDNLIKMMPKVPKALPRPKPKKTDELRPAESATIPALHLPSVPSVMADTGNKTIGTNILYLVTYICLTHIYTASN